MAKFTCMETNVSIEPLLSLDKITARLPTRKLILGNNLRFKNSSYFMKQRKNGGWIIGEAYILNDIYCRATRGKMIMSVTRPNGAGKSNESFIFTRETSHNIYRPSSGVISSLIAYIPCVAIQRLNFASDGTSYAVVIVIIATTVFFLKSSLFLKLFQIPKCWKGLMNPFKGTKCVKDSPEEISKPPKTTSAALIDKDLLSAVDIYRIDGFVLSLCILLAWRLLCRFFLFVRSFYYNYKNVRK